MSIATAIATSTHTTAPMPTHHHHTRTSMEQEIQLEGIRVAIDRDGQNLSQLPPAQCELSPIDETGLPICLSDRHNQFCDLAFFLGTRWS
jgi:hypothetical protein